MKKVLFIAMVMSAGCQSDTPQKKSERAVTAYLKQTLNDPASYAPVKFDSLEVEMSKIEDDLTYILVTGQYDFYNKEYKKVAKDYDIDLTTMSFSDDYKVDAEYMKKYADSTKIYATNLDSLEKVFKPKNIGYVLHHTYRGKNKMNALILQDTNFHLDSLLKVKDYTN